MQLKNGVNDYEIEKYYFYFCRFFCNHNQFSHRRIDIMKTDYEKFLEKVEKEDKWLDFLKKLMKEDGENLEKLFRNIKDGEKNG